MGSAFLKELGFENPAEIARILDIAMNPDSIFVSFKDKKLSKNDNVRSVSLLLVKGMNCCQHASVLGLSPHARLAAARPHHVACWWPFVCARPLAPLQLIR